MYALNGKQIDGIVLVGGKLGAPQLPMFYSGVFLVPVYTINNDEQLNQTTNALRNVKILPNYAIFFGMDDIDQRVQKVESSLGLRLELEKRIEPSFLDDIFYRLNPRNNKNQTAFVFDIKANK